MKSQELTNQNEQVTSQELKKYLQAANLVAHLTSNETDQFISIAQAYGLNPFKREIYASKYGNNFSIVVGYETYIKRAERSGRLDGWNVTVEGVVNEQQPRSSSMKAIITIHRDDFKHPFVHEVHFSEYVQFKRDGQITKFWKEKPITMIKKVAISQGFRLCFSDELGGIPYTKEEIGEDSDYEIVSSAPLKKVPEGSNVTQSKPEPEPVHEVEKPSFEEVEEILQETLNACKSREEILEVWNANPEFKTFDEFKEMTKKAGERIKSEEVEEVQEVQEPEEVEELNSSPGPLFPSENFGAKESIEFIENMKTAEEVNEFIQGDQRKTVNEAATKKLEAIFGKIKNS